MHHICSVPVKAGREHESLGVKLQCSSQSSYPLNILSSLISEIFKAVTYVLYHFSYYESLILYNLLLLTTEIIVIVWAPNKS